MRRERERDIQTEKSGKYHQKTDSKEKEAIIDKFNAQIDNER